jgi:DEAD/DEAH box helicase domain-containing protein
LREVLLKPDKPVQAITFIRSLAGVERFNRTLQHRLQAEKNPSSQKTRTYKSTLIMKDRNEISEGLISGQVVHVTATNALELGIDIGDLNACILIGYPGTVSSTIQQSGRVGRKGDSVVILLVRDDPLEQWFARNPNQFFTNLARVEPLRLPINNPHVVAQQAACAAWDLSPMKGKEVLGGLTQDFFDRYFGKNAKSTVQKIWKEKEFLPPQLRKGSQSYWVILKGCLGSDPANCLIYQRKVA